MHSQWGSWIPGWVRLTWKALSPYAKSISLPMLHSREILQLMYAWWHSTWVSFKSNSYCKSQPPRLELVYEWGWNMPEHAWVYWREKNEGSMVEGRQDGDMKERRWRLTWYLIKPVTVKVRIITHPSSSALVYFQAPNGLMLIVGTMINEFSIWWANSKISSGSLKNYGEKFWKHVVQKAT